MTLPWLAAMEWTAKRLWPMDGEHTALGMLSVVFFARICSGPVWVMGYRRLAAVLVKRGVEQRVMCGAGDDTWDGRAPESRT